MKPDPIEEALRETERTNTAALEAHPGWAIAGGDAARIVMRRGTETMTISAEDPTRVLSPPAVPTTSWRDSAETED